MNPILWIKNIFTKKSCAAHKESKIKSLWKTIRWSNILIGAVIGTLLSTGVGIYLRSCEKSNAERKLADNMSSHIKMELGNNWLAIQIKGGKTLIMLSKEQKGEYLSQYDLDILELFEFENFAWRLWTQDLIVLKSFGVKGEKAYDSVLKAYKGIEIANKQEALIINQLTKEKDSKKRQILLAELVKVCDFLRNPIREALNALNELPLNGKTTQGAKKIKRLEMAYGNWDR